MATHPFALLVDGVNGGANILDDYSTSSPTTPWVDPESVSLQSDASGQGGVMTFDVVQVKTPVGGPWWKSGSVYDSARVRFQVSGTTTFLGTIENISAALLESGLGTRATVRAVDAANFLDKIIVYKGRNGTGTQDEPTSSFTEGTNDDTTDQTIITALLSQADTCMGKGGSTGQAANRQIVATNSAPSFPDGAGGARKVGVMRFDPGTLRSCLDAVKEAAEAADGIQRRYYIRPSDGVLVYEKVAAPAAATAPFKIVTTATYDPTANPSTIQARDLQVELNHEDIVKKARFVMSSHSAKLDSMLVGTSWTVLDPFVRTYDGYMPNSVRLASRSGTTATLTTWNIHRLSVGDSITVSLTSGPTNYAQLNGTYTITAIGTRTISYTTATSGTISSGSAVGYVRGAGMTVRNGPRPEVVIQVNPVPGREINKDVGRPYDYRGYWTSQISAYGRRYFGTDATPNKAAPQRSVSFSIRGAASSGTNVYGYATGNRASDGSSVSWAASQYVEITASSLDLSGLFRIERMTMSFEPGSMIRKFDFECERIRESRIAKYIRKKAV